LPSRARAFRPRFAWPPSSAGLIALALIAALLAGATIWLALLVNGQHSRNSNRDQALQRARQILTDYTTYDYRTADTTFAHLETEFTGTLRAKIHEDLASVVSLIKSGKGTAKGRVADSAVVFQRGDKVSVVLAVDEAVTNTVLSQGAIRRFQFNVVMQKVHGDWFGTTLDLVSVTS
jgi:hypothetical protein